MKFSLKDFYGINYFCKSTENIHFSYQLDFTWSGKTKYSNSVFYQWTMPCYHLPLLEIIFETQQSSRDSYKGTICFNSNCIASPQNKNRNMMYFPP